MIKRFLFLLLPFLCTFLLAAQDRGNGALFTIKGQVVDSVSNETVPYVTLNIIASAAPQVSLKRLACDENGKFETTLQAAGEYIIQMHSVGKLPSQKKIVLSDDKKAVDLGKIFMNDDQQQLGEVMVVAQKPLIKAEIDKLTYSMEDDPEAQTNNTLDMLRKVPMVTVDGEDKIQLKGSSNYKIYMNGKPSNMLSGNNASDVLKSMPASSVKNIEVITDPGAKYDAEGIGGIINIITSKNSLQGYTANVRAGVSALGRFNTGANVSTKIGKLGITANYGFNRYNSPWNTSEYYRESYEMPISILSQRGEQKSKNNFNFGSFEASYEIDSLNLISVGANLWKGNFKTISELMVNGQLNHENDIFNYKYSQDTETKGDFGSVDANIDFQHSTKKKDELLTLSYKFSHNPNNSNSYATIESIENYSGYKRHNENDAYTNEHTAQIDYTTPLRKDQTLEAGLKYILRESISNTEERIKDDSATDWISQDRLNSDFKHTQHIYAGYLGYSLKYAKFGYKAGLRAEGTALSAKFKKDKNLDFNSDYFDVVPNATISYQINQTKQIRLGYNMRIHRPSIWYLNPYFNNTDPQNVSYGNPNLKSEKSHGLNLNYSLFTMKFNFNANLTYRFVNNAILRYSFINLEENGRIENTYFNIGKNHTAGLYLYGRWAPVRLFSINLNGGMSYVDLSTDKDRTSDIVEDLSNHGFNGNLFGNLQFNLPKDFIVYLNGGFFKPQVQLQYKMATQHFHGFSINKNLLNKKMTISLSCQNPFKKDMKQTQTYDGIDFYSQSMNFYRMRDVRINISYRFGTLKDSIKKVKRGISNDDVKAGESGNQNSGGQQSM